MAISRRQMLALRFLAAAPWNHDSAVITAVLVTHGEKSPNGKITADALVRKGLAIRTFSMLYRVSRDGMKFLKQKGGE